MALLDGQVQVGGLLMGEGTIYNVDNFNPWSRQVRADQGDSRAWGHGSWSGAEWTEQVVVPMMIEVTAGDADAWQAAHQAMLAAFAPRSEDVELRWRFGATEYVMFGRPRMVEPDVRMIGLGFSVTRAAFVALDSHIYSSTEHSLTLGLPSVSGGLEVPVTVPGGPTLNANPFFEVDASSWTGQGGTVARSTTQFHEGVASLLLTPDGVSAVAEARSELVPVTAGSVYRAMAWVRCASARNINCNINWYTAADVFLSNTIVTVAVAANTWTLLANTATAPVGAAKARLIPASLTGTPPGSDTTHIDEARIWQYGGPGIGLTIPATVTAGRAQITNAGTADVGLMLRIDGPVVEPRVSLLTPAGTAIVRVWVTLTSGQWLDIDTGARTVYLQGTASRRGLTTAEGIGWPVLPRGSHELAFAAATYEASAQLTATWRDAWH